MCGSFPTKYNVLKQNINQRFIQSKKVKWWDEKWFQILRKQLGGVDSSEFGSNEIQYIIESTQRELDNAISESMAFFTVSLILYFYSIVYNGKIWRSRVLAL